ncbi:hypothetical protein [Anaeromyxobacter oryzae]|uniref:Uncharacterized protein n=1 Tax=Anaeromyxobacter oryzae TaxID=2918170 RepID=A0ABN6MV21_9BACT|nr:hypothetical protein [Anaeromyxobacter oryzae]BDG04819.1 hypothetical protein AMOR_38150 [Anaeromyxobacter oryzae]
MSTGGEVVRRGGRGARSARIAAIVALALAGVFAAMTRLSIAGHWYGLYLLRGKEGPTFEIKDDLLLGDGSRLVAGVPLSPLRRLFTARAAGPEAPRLELQWDEREGSGIIRNHLADGTELVTLFSRFQDSEGATPHGLFVGGALPDIAADPGAQNESGMTHHDARGWTHIWCNVNEAIWLLPDETPIYPSYWRFLGSRVLVRDGQRVVLESSHELERRGARLRMDRFAYFRAGRPFFKLGIRVVNLGDLPATYTYAYGDEPWVGEFGSAEGNLGWVAGGIVTEESQVDARVNRWAGIVDSKTGAADFIAWVGDDQPDLVFFANQPGLQRPGVPLASNEVFIGLEWHGRALAPGEERAMLLSIGMADRDPRTGRPALPEGGGP